MDKKRSDDLEVVPGQSSTAPILNGKLQQNKADLKASAGTSSAPFTLRDSVNKILNEDRPDTDPETFKAALDAVRFEHQRLQNEFMSLMTLNEHVQQKLERLFDDNVKMELDLEARLN